MLITQYLAIIDIHEGGAYTVCVGNVDKDVLEVWKTCQQVPRTQTTRAQVIWPSSVTRMGGNMLYEVTTDDDAISSPVFHVVGFQPVYTIPSVDSLMFKMSHSEHTEVLTGAVATHTSHLESVIKALCCSLHPSNYGVFLENLRGRLTPPEPLLEQLDDGSDEEVDDPAWRDLEEVARALKRSRVDPSRDNVEIETGHHKFKRLLCLSSAVDFLFHVVRIDLVGMFGRFDLRCSTGFVDDEFERISIGNKYWSGDIAALRAPWVSPRKALKLSSTPSDAIAIILSWLTADVNTVPAQVVFRKFGAAFPKITAGQRVAIASRVLNQLRDKVYSRWSRVRSVKADSRVFTAMGIGGRGPAEWALVGAPSGCDAVRTEIEEMIDSVVIEPDWSTWTTDPGTTVLTNAHRATPRQLVDAFRMAKRNNLTCIFRGNPYHVGFEYGGIWHHLTMDTPLLPIQVLQEYERVQLDSEAELQALLADKTRCLAVTPRHKYPRAAHIVDVLSAKSIAADFLVTSVWDSHMMSCILSAIKPKIRKPCFYFYGCSWE